MTDSLNIFTTNIENDTLQNTYFRKVLFTTKNQQLVIMSIKPKEDIPFEIHPKHDQFIRIEKGKGRALIGKNKEKEFTLNNGTIIMIPANTWHQIVNISDTEDLKLYTIYSPPEHPISRIDINKPMEGGLNLSNNAIKAKYYKYKYKYLKNKNKINF